MVWRKKRTNRAMWIALSLLIPAVGCERQRGPSEEPPSPAAKVVSARVLQGPATTAVAVDMSLGWCAGHGVPESVCTRCNDSLIPLFKAGGDWCGGHDLPESQCTICNPEAEAEWAKLHPDAQADGGGGSEEHAPPGSKQAVASVPQGPATTGVAVDMSFGWCAGHGVPESVCTRCNDSLVPLFKAAGDWCGGHDLPESQCTICNPEVEAEWAKIDPDAQGDGASEEIVPWGSSQTKALSAPKGEGQLGLAVERVPRLLTGTSDPLCKVETLRVRFIDSTIARQAGIEIERVQRRRMSAVLEIPAEVEFDATRVTRVAPRLAGVVLEAFVDVGDEVEAGDLLAVIDSPELGKAKSRLIERTQDLRLAEADRRRTHTIDEGVQRMLRLCTPDRPADAVRDGLAEFPVGQAKAKLLRAHASLLLARTEAVRESTLLKQGIGTDQMHETAQAALAAAEADFAALREEISFDSARALLAADHARAVARSAFEAAERELHILGLSEEQVAGVGHEAHAVLTRHELRSPADGRVVERRVVSGEWVEVAEVLFVVVDMSSMWVVGDAQERDLLRLRKGQSVLFTASGLPGVSFEGKLRWVSSRVGERTRTVRVRADVPNADELLRAGMFGEAKIVLHDDDDVVSVPLAAVQTDGCCQLVFVQRSETVYEPRKILLGSSAGGFVEVLRGLAEGETVATVGSFLLKTEILKGNIGAGCCDVDPGR